jgi:hypothetical protein
MALWYFARRRRGAPVFVFAVLALDLVLWGQSSGWRVASAKADYELWSTPATVQFLRARAAGEKTKNPYRIFTQDKYFDPATPGMSGAPGGAWVPALQPDIYMMWGEENAAGYEGFGLARYSRLAGDMKVWGELTEPERTLRSESRELDLLNVRYLLARSSPGVITGAGGEAAFPSANQTYGGQHFGEEDLAQSNLGAGDRVSFTVPPVESDHIALLTTMAWSEAVPDHEIVARIGLTASTGETFDFVLRAGDDTAEWAHDRPDIHSRIRHQRPQNAVSYEVSDGPVRYQAHSYVSSFTLPRKVRIRSGEITVAKIEAAPRLQLNVSRITFARGDRSFPLRKSWLERRPAAASASPESAEQKPDRPSHWARVGEVQDVAVFENTHALPRAWLARGELVAGGEEQLAIIRTGRTPDGVVWDPLATALVESSAGFAFGKRTDEPPQSLPEVTRTGPDRLEVKTHSVAPTVLVLSENYYPGWRARVDGRAVKILRVNYNQRGILLSSGDHLVTFVYRPRSVLFGLIVSGLTVSLLLVWMSPFGDRFSPRFLVAGPGASMT